MVKKIDSTKKGKTVKGSGNTPAGTRSSNGKLTKFEKLILSTHDSSFFEEIVATNVKSLFILDSDLRVIFANRSFYKNFKVAERETIGTLIYELGNNQWDIPKLRELLENILPEKQRIDGFQVEHDFETIGKRVMLVNAEQKVTSSGKQKLIVVDIIDITYSNRIKKALEISEERFRTAFETAKDGILLIEKSSGHVLNSNEAAQKLLGYSRDQFENLDILKLGFIKDDKEYQRVYAELEKLGLVDFIDIWIKKRSGGKISTDVYMVDRSLVFQMNIRDITGRKLIEDELKNKKDLLSETEQIGNIGGWEFDIDTLKQNWTEGVFHIHELDPALQPTVSQGINFYTPESRIVIERAVQRAIEHGESFNEELQIKTAKGNIRFVQTIGKPDLAHRKIVGFFQDITERKHAEENLQKSEALFRAVLDSTHFPVAVVDRQDDHIFFWSRSAQTLFGHTAPRVSEWYQIAYPDPDYRRDVIERWKPALEKAKQSSQVVNTGEYQVTCRDGSDRICELYASFQGEHLIVTFNDITERRRAEILLDALNKASVSMSAVLKPQDIFLSVAKELERLDIACMLFLLDETKSKLIPEYMSFKSATIKKIEKLVSFKRKDLSFPLDAVEVYKAAVSEKKTIFSEDSEQIIRQVLPKGAAVFAPKIVDLLHVQRGIFAPMIVEDRVVGVFSIQADTLTKEDIPATTAFTHELAGAWNKAKLVQELRRTIEGTIYMVAATSEIRDPYTAGHQARVSELAASIAQEMHLSEDQIEGIHLAGLIHDLGKIQVPAEILSKPGKISELEFNLIKTHPQIGYDLLKNIEFPWPIAQMVHQHHEKMDGSGYPQGLAGDEIMLEARILSVADIVEAMSSHRPYRPAFGIEKALEQIKLDRGTLLDPDVVDACLKLFKEGYSLPEV